MLYWNEEDYGAWNVTKVFELEFHMFISKTCSKTYNSKL